MMRTVPFSYTRWAAGNFKSTKTLEEIARKQTLDWDSVLCISISPLSWN
jgi:hypothetical protein